MEGLPKFDARDREGLAQIFRYFATVETPRMDSRLYEEFSFGVASDPEVLDLASQIDRGQPAPNILFGAVQDLLFEDSSASPEALALSAFYPAVSGRGIPEGPAWPAFRNFCLAHSVRLGPRLRTGRTQTCVVHRCTIILPTLAVLPRVDSANGRVGLLEIGPSAGLNLRMDRYRYDYGDGLVWGDANARPELHCEIRGDSPPPMPGRLDVVARRGLDLHPIDLDDPGELRWLKALVWPEHAKRAKVMAEAFELARSVPVEIEAGDATTDIQKCVARLPSDAARVVFATHVFYQISSEGRMAILDGLTRASTECPVDLVVMESTGVGDSRVDWYPFEAGERKKRKLLAHSDSHGRWIQWGEAAS